LSRKEAEEREEKERQLRAERIQREADQALQRNAAASLAAKQQVSLIFCSKIRGKCTETVCTTLATDENTGNNIPVHTVKKVYRFSRPQPGCHLQNLFPGHSGTGLICEMVLVKKLKLEASGHECRKQYS